MYARDLCVFWAINIDVLCTAFLCTTFPRTPLHAQRLSTASLTQHFQNNNKRLRIGREALHVIPFISIALIYSLYVIYM